MDSGAFFALASTRDENHRRARDINGAIRAGAWELVTTNFVLAELHALTLGRHGSSFALQVLTGIDSSGVQIIKINEDDERRAREILARYSDKDFSLTDATSFAVMERLGIGRAFCFDRHFLQFGFDVLGLVP